MQAFILAGGLGTRLHPYTTNLPKPLMPVGGRPILEVIVNQLKLNGFNSIIMGVGHLHHMIEAHFLNGSDFGVSIEYSLERTRLGTAGPIGLVLEKLDDHFLVMNGDLLTDMRYSELLDLHIANGWDASIAVQKRSVNIDFGVLDFDKEQRLVDYREKPDLDYHVSMGVNVFSKSSVEPYLNGKDPLDIPDLMKRMLTDGKDVRCYESACRWLDIGRPDDYQKAIELFEKEPQQY